MTRIPATSLVLFDIDGTLLRRSGPQHKLALAGGIRRVVGIETTLDGVSTHGMLDSDLIAVMLERARFSGEHSIELFSDIAREAENVYLEICPSDLTGSLCPGVPAVLQRLSEDGVCLGLVTGNFRRIGGRKLELSGLSGFFSIGAFSESGSTRAALAGMAIAHARRLNLIAADSRIALVGDHPNDVWAARANGVRAIATATGLTSRDELKRANPDVLVDDLTELATGKLFDLAS